MHNSIETLPRRTRHLATLGAVIAMSAAALGACDRDVTAPNHTPGPTARGAAPLRAAPSGLRAYSSSAQWGVITVQSAEGTFRLDTHARTLSHDTGPAIHLSAEATDTVRAMLQQVVDGDAAAAAAGAVQPPPAPTPRCLPWMQYCGGEVSEPNHEPGVGTLAGGEAGAYAGSLSTVVVSVGDSNFPWSCLEISRAIYDLTPHYRPARAAYTAALKQWQQALEQAAVGYAGGEVPVAAITRLAVASGILQTARAGHDYWSVRLGVLATLFHANACLYRAWDPAPVAHTGGTGGGGEGGGSGGGGGSATMCYWTVTYDGMVEISRELIDCRVTMAN
jgi:hypothetical protein